MTPTRQLGVFLDDCGSLLRFQTDPGLVAHLARLFQLCLTRSGDGRALARRVFSSASSALFRKRYTPECNSNA